METFIALIVGILGSFITERAKEKKNARLIIMALALIIGVGYAIFDIFLPGELKQNIIQFVLVSLGSMASTYNFLIKNIKDE